MIRLMQQSFDQTAVESLGWALVHFLWQGAAVALVLAILLTLLRRSSALARYLAACLALLTLAALPIGTFLFLVHRSAPAPIKPQIAASPAALPSKEVPSHPVTAPPSPQPPYHFNPPLSAISLQNRLRPALPWLVTGWLLGVLVLSVRLVGGWTQLQTLKHQAAPPPSEWAARLLALSQQLRICQPIRLLAAARIDVPCTLGWIEPVILIPTAVLSGLSPQQLEAILAHELAHIRRHDYLVNLLQNAIEALLFYHPAVWWVSRQIRIEREHCCDDIAADACGNPLLYARALTTLEELRVLPPTLAPAATGAPLLPRIRRLLALPPADHRAPWWPAGALALITLLSLAAALRLSHASATPTTQPTADITCPTFVGTITTTTGTPIASARVSLILPASIERVRPLLRRTNASVLTQPDGSFRLESPEPVDLRDGLTQLVIEAQGYAINSAQIAKQDAASTTDAVRVSPIRMKPEAQLHVPFIGPDGKPVAGLKVVPNFVRDRNWPDLGWWTLSVPQDVQDRLAQRTDADGVCTLRSMPRESVVTLNIEDDRFAQLSYENRVPIGNEATATAAPIRLKRAASIKGRVVFGDTNKPVAGVLVSAGSDVRSPLGFGQAVTNDQGEYHIKQLSATTYGVRVFPEPELAKSWTAAPIAELRITEGEQRENIHFQLIKGGVITGRVVLKDTRQGVPNIQINAESSNRSGLQITTTASDGSFWFRLPPGKRNLRIAARPPEGYLGWLETREAQVDEGQTITMTLELPRDPSPPVAGRVIDAENNPVAGAVVTAQPVREGSYYPDYVRVARTDQEGRFRFPTLAAGSRLRASNGQLGTVEPVVTRGQEDNLTLRLQKDVTPTLLVAVEDTTGKAIKGARLWMTFWEDSGGGMRPSDPIGVTDAEGHCLLPKLSVDRRYALMVTADGFTLDGGYDLPVKLTPGQQNTMKVVLRPVSK
ncbi:MAG: carboxypeptidase regulatory-like domain-containing protein [Bacillota bacterium]